MHSRCAEVPPLQPSKAPSKAQQTAFVYTGSPVCLRRMILAGRCPKGKLRARVLQKELGAERGEGVRQAVCLKGLGGREGGEGKGGRGGGQGAMNG